jgi:hypothetical protein
MSVVDGSFDHPLKLEEKATIPLAGGIVNQGYQCGMIWGATLAAGAQAYRSQQTYQLLRNIWVKLAKKTAERSIIHK